MIDIHMHTVYSDGSKTVEEVLKMCEEKKLEYISITDHDNCKQYEDEAWDKNIFSGKVIKGSELHAVFNNRKIEILAYGIDTKISGEWLEKYYSDEKLRENQVKCTKMLLDIFDKLGIVYNKDNITLPEKPTDFVEKPIYNEAMKYKENHEKFGEFAQAFRKLYREGITNPESVFFMEPIGTPQYKEVIDAIHQAGGKAFLAHPFEYKFEDTVSFIDDLRKEKELDGIECFHPSADEDKMQVLVDYARKNNLYISGGSDYHGKSKPDIEIGIGKGNMNISRDIIEEWI